MLCWKTACAKKAFPSLNLVQSVNVDTCDYDLKSFGFDLVVVISVVPLVHAPGSYHNSFLRRLAAVTRLDNSAFRITTSVETPIKFFQCLFGLCRPLVSSSQTLNSW